MAGVAYRLHSEGDGARKKVAHVVAAGEFGGAEAQILALLSDLEHAPVEWQVVTMYDAEFAARVRALGIPVKVLGSRHMLADVRQLCRFFKDSPPDVLHTHGVRASVAGRLVGEELGIPVVTTVHSDLFYDYAAPLKREVMLALERFTRDKSARVIAVSSPLAQTLLARGYGSQQVIVVPNGLDVVQAERAIEAAKNTPARLKEQLGIPLDAFLVITVARLQAVKNLPLLFGALAGLKEVHGRPVHLVVVGDGPDREALERFATELAAQEGGARIHLLGKRNDVFALLLEADVFTLPSLMEGMPISIMEAMLCGLPAVASRVGGIPDLVAEGEGETGILVPQGDQAAFGKAIESLLLDGDRRQKQGANARKRLHEKFALARMQEQNYAIYKNVTNS